MRRDRTECRAVKRDIGRLFAGMVPHAEREALRARIFDHARPFVNGETVIKCFDCWKEFVRQEAVH